MPLEREEWRDVKDAPGYRVSNLGCVVSFWRRVKPFGGATFDKWQWQIDYTVPPRFLKMGIRDGYNMVPIHSDGRLKHRFVHLLVLESFVSARPDGLQGRHLNDDKRNNCLSNLAWGTPSQNIRERHINSTEPVFKLVPADVQMVKDRLKQGESQSSVARSLGVHQSLISRINSGKRWGWANLQEVMP